jgi:hypothetical protein
VLFDEKRMVFLGLYPIMIDRKVREEEKKTLVFCNMKKRGNLWRISAN